MRLRAHLPTLYTPTRSSFNFQNGSSTGASTAPHDPLLALFPMCSSSMQASSRWGHAFHCRLRRKSPHCSALHTQVTQTLSIPALRFGSSCRPTIARLSLGRSSVYAAAMDNGKEIHKRFTTKDFSQPKHTNSFILSIDAPIPIPLPLHSTCRQMRQ